ncbi:unnamed protein product [Arctia plantaginis]|uniref:Uncharacterized protein n=1 Tax=Arctia plantaginis TaxID=874455 RepID=A0A8S1BKN2_ARCPL|nr:unnamed protein product [Arctia plantaginis]
MSSWRMAGLNYVNYSNISARVLRQSVKGAKKEDPKAPGTSMRFFFWVNGELLAEGKKPDPTDAKGKAG